MVVFFWFKRAPGQSRGTMELPLATIYAHIEIVVTFLVVNFFGFLVMVRNPQQRF